MHNLIQKAQERAQAGALYVLATPIGNLSDITLRALAILQKADLICAEDTRVTTHLMQSYGISAPLWSVREHNEREMAEKIIEQLKLGKIVVQVSDAGTPAICDPGARLVQSVRDENLPVIPIPGACAAIAALSVSGIISSDFYFAGFLNPKKSARMEQLKEIIKSGKTTVFYESPHRILDTLTDLSTLPERSITLARELTKTFETFLQGNALKLLDILQRDAHQCKGEMVLIIHPTDATEESTDSLLDIENLLQLLATELPTKQAAKIAASITGLPKNQLYNQIVELKSNEK